MLSIHSNVAIRTLGPGLLNGPLGVVPSEVDLAKVFQYRPVHQGWIQADFLGSATGTPEERLAALEAIQNRVAKWQAISAVSVFVIATAAFVGMVRSFKR
jgi:hypothetical protein